MNNCNAVTWLACAAMLCALFSVCGLIFAAIKVRKTNEFVQKEYADKVRKLAIAREELTRIQAFSLPDYKDNWSETGQSIRRGAQRVLYETR